jgi:hypothetical protein
VCNHPDRGRGEPGGRAVAGIESKARKLGSVVKNRRLHRVGS